MPVRIKQRTQEFQDGKESEKLFDTLKKELVGLLLAWGKPIDVSVRTSEGVQKLRVRESKTSGKPSNEGDSNYTFGVSFARTILSQAAYIDPSSWSHWVPVSARTPLITIQGAISTEPAPSKLVQFMALGLHAVDGSVSGSILHEEINRLFAASRFGTQQDVLHVEERNSIKPDRRKGRDGLTIKELKGGAKSIDRWPMFFIQIQLHDGQALCSDKATDVLDKQSALSIITRALTAMVSSFLQDHHFQHRKRPARKRQDQDTAGMTTSRRLIPASQSSSPRTRNKGAITDPIGNDVQIPTPTSHGVRLSTDGFGSWSRIKSGSRSILQELTPQKVTFNPSEQSCISETASKDACLALPSYSSVHEQAGSHEDQARTASIALDASRSMEKRPCFEMDACNTEIDEGRVMLEETIPWTNPVSKEAVLVNARTGLVIAQPHAIRTPGPYSRPPNGQTYGKIPSSNSHSKSRSLLAFTPPKKDSWIGALLENWDNPIFKPTEKAIPRTSLSGFDIEAAAISGSRSHCCSFSDVRNAFTESSSPSLTRLSKSGLQTATVISQVEKKFILVSMRAMPSTQILSGAADERASELLVLIDQHAADERVRVESLLAQLCSPPSQRGKINSVVTPSPSESAIATTTLAKAMIFEIPAQEQNLFAAHRGHFADWGILYDLAPKTQSSSASAGRSYRLLVKTLPEAIAERCRLEPKVLIELLRGQVWTQEEGGHSARLAKDQTDLSTVSNGWISRIHDCPQGMIDMINSRSCRSAIMFNDELTIEECQSLVQRLAQCAFPFQCAHGRPSMIPLVDVTTSSLDRSTGRSASGSIFTSETQAGEGIRFSQAWKDWKK